MVRLGSAASAQMRTVPSPSRRVRSPHSPSTAHTASSAVSESPNTTLAGSGAFYFGGVTDGDSVWCRVRRYRSGTYSVVSLGGNIRASAPSSTKDTGVAQCVPNVFKVKNGDWLELAAMNNTASRGVIPSASGNASSTYLTVIYLT